MQSAALMTTLLLGIPLSATADEAPAAAKYKALVNEFEREGGARGFSKRFLALAEQHPHTPVAADALLWVVDKVRGRAETTRALEILATNYVQSEKLGPACKAIAASRSVAAEDLLRAVLEKSTDQQVRAQACFYLAVLLDREATIVEQLRGQPKLAPRVLQYYGKEYGRHLSALKPVQLAQQREQVYEKLLANYPEVDIQSSTMGKIAEKALFQIRHLSVGRVAPEIAGEDIAGKAFKLSDYRGRIVMLTFWGHW